jgi:hypothetical protein
MNDYPNIEDLNNTVPKYFGFLEKEYGFEIIKPYWVSYEYHLGYRSSKVELSIWCEAGTSLPFVIVKPVQPSPHNRSYYYIEELGRPEQLKQVYIQNGSRNNTRYERYIKAIIENSNEASEIYSEIKTDYKEFGNKELEIVLSINADLLKDNPRILNGDFSCFTKSV